MPAYLQYKLPGGRGGRRAEVLIHLLWSKDPFPEDKYAFSYSEVTPSLIQFINHSTHILSYYKEAFFDLEQGNFVELAAGGVKAMKQIDEIPTDPLIIERLQEFTKGWIMFGIAHRSYGLVRMLEDQDLQPYDKDFQI
ncbi:terpenoid synthase [Penicillium canescens]|nr:terpenoid synthase [Penicillium canescens]